LGDALQAVMCGAGHNLRLILAALRLLCARFSPCLACPPGKNRVVKLASDVKCSGLSPAVSSSYAADP